MAFIHIGPKAFVENALKKEIAPTQSNTNITVINTDTTESLKSKIIELELQLSKKEYHFIETIKEVPVEVIKEIKTEIRVIEEKIVEKPIEIIKEIPVEVIKEVKVIEEKIVEKINEIEKFVNVIPKWVFGVMAIETVIVIILLITKLK